MSVVCLVVRSRRLPCIVIAREWAPRLALQLSAMAAVRGVPVHWEERED